MEAIITGDIKNSRNTEAKVWLPELKSVLNHYGKNPSEWEIYRGDSFQLRLAPKKAVLAMAHIKAAIKQHKGLDVRMAIGIGAVSYSSQKITESNGEGFINSGEAFETLKKETIAIKTPWKDFDESMGLMLQLASVKMDEWTPNSAEIVKAIIENPDYTQKELAKHLNKERQSDISKGIKRAGYDVLKKLMNYYTHKTDELC